MTSKRSHNEAGKRTQHTVGPWEVREGKIWSPLSLTYPADLCLPCDATPDERAQAEADWNLLAAAPELLEALRGLLKSSTVDGQELSIMPSCLAWSNCRAAIAKAEGK
jgi:hypothetical protein